MAVNVDPALITQFSAMVHHDAQQMMARTRPHIQLKPMMGDDFAYDGLGTVEARKITGRNVKVEFDDIEHLRRRITRDRFAVVLPIDASDFRGLEQSQMQGYSTAITAAINRQVDRIVVGAAFADVATGRNFETTIASAADGVITVDASAGLTYAKILEMSQNFTDNEVGNDIDETFHLYYTGKEQTGLMQETELTSGDFTRHNSVDKGRMISAGEFLITRFGASVNNPILAEGATLRDCIAMTSRAICLGISKDISLSIEERNDLHETTQVVATIEMGAVRTEGKLIQKVQTTI